MFHPFVSKGITNTIILSTIPVPVLHEYLYLYYLPYVRTHINTYGCTDFTEDIPILSSTYVRTVQAFNIFWSQTSTVVTIVIKDNKHNEVDLLIFVHSIGTHTNKIHWELSDYPILNLH